MGSLIRSPQITVVNKDGQCDIHITLDLNINVNGAEVSGKPKKEEDETVWEIPSFKSTEKINFGNRKEI